MTEKRDYRDTVFLPKTDFPMKAGLPQKEPAILAKWLGDGLYEKLRDARRGREKFVLHDGPPYANGDIHVGHALNHILKDMVVRTQTLLGKDAPYVPGWDCHGLPIEWKVEEAYRKKKLNKDEVPVEEFRAECRAYAQGWVDTQREQLKRLGINGDWDNPYLTMAAHAEGTIVAELMKFAESGQLYRGSKPVMWSPVEKTALAEAEVEYEDITSTQVDVAFEITESPIPELVGAYAVIWTTTPWTIPVNQAIAYGADVDYCVVEFSSGPLTTSSDHGSGSMSAQSALANQLRGKRILVSQFLHGRVIARLRAACSAEVNGAQCFPDFSLTKRMIKGSDLAGTIARHPMANHFTTPLPCGEGLGEGVPTSETADHPHPTLPLKGEGLNPLAEFYLRPRPFLDGSAFVTTDSGTGLVHMAPDHGEDDFDLCKVHGIEPQFAVTADGKYRADWPWLGGQGSVINPKFNAPNGPICTDLREAGGLLAASADYKHSYPHSWRSKAKVIYRCTPQWFVPMDKNLSPLQGREGSREAAEREGDTTLRQTATAAIAATRFVPEKGRNRIGSMVEGRPDWVLSRQRAWGVPITLFVDRKTSQYLCDPAVNARIIAAVKADGVDAWSDARTQEFLGADYQAEDYERITDILDVWFDSGCTHAFVLESGKWPDLVTGQPADLYLEGSDQHRGWFQSSLLESCATRGRAPYKAVLTHGFTMDAKGMKMSKSLGNTVDPIKVMETNGADIIRLWALSVDYTEDHRIGDEILKGVADQYRKLRNTFRYLLGALDGFSEAERVNVGDMPELERYILALLAKLDETLRQAVADFDFNTYTRALSDFCNEDLSAFFFDIRKDSLYCDAANSPKRMAYRTVLDTLFHALVRYAAPVLVFTAEEVWGTRFADAGSVHLLEWPELPNLRHSQPPLRHSREGGNPSPIDAAGETPVMDPRLRGDDELVEKWARLREFRTVAFAAAENARREKFIGSSLEAKITLVPTDQLNQAGILSAIDYDIEKISEIFISGEVHVPQGNPFQLREIAWSSDKSFGAVAHKSTHHKCGRCWRHLPEVIEDGDLCNRCDEVVTTQDATA